MAEDRSKTVEIKTVDRAGGMQTKVFYESEKSGTIAVPIGPRESAAEVAARVAQDIKDGKR